MKNLSHVNLFLKRQAPTILSCLGAIGVVATTCSAIKASPEACKIRQKLRWKHEMLDKDEPTKFEYLKETWKCYIPTTVLGISTVACIFGSNALNKNRYAALSSAYMLLDNSYKTYKNKVEEELGTGSDNYIQKSIIEDKYKDESDNFLGEQHLFWEFNYGEFFERNRGEVLRAEYLFNKKFATDKFATLNDFYDLLDLPRTEYGDALCWHFWEGSPWIDFKHELLPLEDGMECYVITYSVDPNIDAFPEED